MTRTALVVCLTFAVGAPHLAAAEPPVLDVWPGAVPGEKGDVGEEHVLPDQPGRRTVRRLANVTKPTITVYAAPADKANGAAVLVCPGGGYSILAMDLEGEEVAEWLNSMGVTAILLKYRVPRREELPKHLAPLQDAQRAMSLVRANAAKWGIDPERIGILGFSAGGHLAAVASTNYDRRAYPAIDASDEVSCRPDFAVLVYPAYLIAEDGSLAPEVRVRPGVPPIFFAHADDDGISSENSVAVYLALKRAKITTELHVYASGGHGFGLRPSEHPASRWPSRCAEWLQGQGWLAPRKSK